MKLSGLSKTHEGSDPSQAYFFIKTIFPDMPEMGIYIPDLHMDMYFLQKFK